jgi:hypothetical protein
MNKHVVTWTLLDEQHSPDNAGLAVTQQPQMTAVNDCPQDPHLGNALGNSRTTPKGKT